MLRKRLKYESGYSLIEVMVSIILLTIAILPMAGMFDMGLRSATTGSNYDKARDLANLKMEEAKSRPFVYVENNFPAANTTPPYVAPSAWFTQGGDFTNFEYRIKKQYIAQPSQSPTSSSENFATTGTPTNLIRITVIVQWGNSNTYTTFGLVSA